MTSWCQVREWAETIRAINSMDSWPAIQPITRTLKERLVMEIAAAQNDGSSGIGIVKRYSAEWFLALCGQDSFQIKMIDEEVVITDSLTGLAAWNISGVISRHRAELASWLIKGPMVGDSASFSDNEYSTVHLVGIPDPASA